MTKRTQAELEQAISIWHIKTKPITKRQGKQQLVIAGLDEQVGMAIDGITDPTERKLTRIWYEDATEWERENAQLLSLANALGLTDAQVDDLFIQASKL